MESRRMRSRSQILKWVCYAVALFVCAALQTTPGLLQLGQAKPLFILPLCLAVAVYEGEFAGALFGDDIVKFEVDDATRFHWGGLYGRIVTNPPYGERLLEREEAGELYKAFGKAMDKLPDTWRVYVLSSHPDFERCYGRFADKKRKLYNGMLKCDLFMYGKRL